MNESVVENIVIKRFTDLLSDITSAKKKSEDRYVKGILQSISEQLLCSMNQLDKIDKGEYHFMDLKPQS